MHPCCACVTAGKHCVPLYQLFSEDNLRSLHLDQLLVVVVDDRLLQLLLLLLSHGDWVRGRCVGLIVEWTELVGPHVSYGSTRSALQLGKETSIQRGGTINLCVLDDNSATRGRRSAVGWRGARRERGAR